MWRARNSVKDCKTEVGHLGSTQAAGNLEKRTVNNGFWKAGATWRSLIASGKLNKKQDFFSVTRCFSLSFLLLPSALPSLVYFPFSLLILFSMISSSPSKRQTTTPTPTQPTTTATTNATTTSCVLYTTSSYYTTTSTTSFLGF